VEIEHAWSEMRIALRDAVGERTFGLWLEPLEAYGLEDEALVLIAPVETATWVSERLGRVLQACAAAVLGPEIVVDITTREALRRRPRTAAAPERGNGRGRRAHSDPSGQPGSNRPAGRPKTTDAHTTPDASLSLNPKYTFEQFVIGDSNRLAHAAALSVAEMPAQAYNPLFIYGPPGLGKTHLLHSIANYVQAFGGGLSVRYTTVEAFTNEFIHALGGGSIDAFKSRFRRADVLLVDDVQFLERKVRTEEELFHTFNALYESGSQLVLTSDRLPSDLSALEDRLRERFQAGLVTDIGRPDYTTRLAILRKRAQHDGLVLDDARPLELIAKAVTANVRALEGALIRVVAYASLTSKRIDDELARKVLSELGPRSAQQEPTSLDHIQAAAAHLFGLTTEQLLSRSRAERFAWPRQLAMYLSRELTDHSLPAIGRAFGGRDHTTVLSACRRATARIASDPEAYAQLSALNAACTKS
jgi:chromosomal replication initiator protein